MFRKPVLITALILTSKEIARICIDCHKGIAHNLPDLGT
jgi:nitrate/TMAO reductase-like tetraheme cytochrome c subunit